MKSITVQVRTVYGNEMIYPIDEAARAFTSLTGKKTLSRYDINKIKELGFTVNVQPKVTQL